jgi:predicted DsbA family dithiol-disulfide isomerase
LFIAYHTDGIHPSDLDTLANIAMKYELFANAQEAKAWLETGDEYDEEVKKGYNSARAMGVSGVPFFIVDNKYAISGAVGEEAFTDVSRGLESFPSELTCSFSRRRLAAKRQARCR